MIAMLYLGAYTLYALMYFPVMLVLRMAFPTARGKKILSWTLAVIWLLVPTADYIVGLAYFKYLCHSDQMGLKVYRTVEEKKGIQVDSGSGGAKHLLETYDLDYVESTHPRIKVRSLFRYTLDQTGELQWKEIEKPISSYIYEYTQVKLPLNVIRYESTITERKTGGRLAENSSYSFHCGWASPYRCIHQCRRKNAFLKIFYEQVLSLRKRKGEQ